MIVGRPLRFLGVIVGGWVALRTIIMWWPADRAPVTVAQSGRADLPAVAAATAPPASLLLLSPDASVPPTGRTSPRLPDVWYGSAAATDVAPPGTKPIAPPSQAPLGPVTLDGIWKAGRHTKPTTRARLAGSFWLIARRGGPVDVLGAQLGGSQTGARITYALGSGRRIAIAARIASPLGPGARELAIGLDWQPMRLPVHVIVEQRIALNGGRGGPTLGLVGGIGPAPIASRLTLEGYAQTGIIARGGGEGFADGAVRVAHPIAGVGRVRFDLGAGAWGGAQKGAARLDLGPSLVAHVPLGRQAVRMSIDWRQRVAGEARPGSGLTVTLGADF